jgi:Cu(I)/Ag(I) efflux system membrane fusion protein
MNRVLSAAAVATLVLSVALPGCVAATDDTPKSGSAMPATIVDPYVKIADSLAKDSLDGVKANAGEIATASSALGAPAMKIDTSAMQLASAVEIEDAREKFGVLSEAIIAYVDGFHLTLPEGVRVASCPMKQKPWLQRGSGIENPYYGSSMLTCGDFR